MASASSLIAKYQGVDTNGTAMKMMKTMGWKEGKGIGANDDGMTSHIHVKKRREGTGIGADVTENSKFNWTVNTDAFDAVLKGLNEVHGNDEGSDEGTKAKKEKKKARKEREAEEEDKKEKHEKKGPARGLPQGRYQKRELNKNVRGYSAKDLGAILGVAVPGGDAWGALAAAQEESDDEEVKAEKAKKAERARKKRCLIVIEAPEREEERLTAAAKEKLEEFFRQAPDWWGCNVFRSSGRLGEQKKLEDEEVKRGFEEADQERLFLSTHAGATSGKQGLGIADRTKKVAGARWGGSKKAFGEEEEGEGDAAEGGAEGEAKGEKAIKWKKYAEQALGEAKGGKLSTNKLLKRVCSLVGVDKGDEDKQDSLRLEMLTKLKGSSRFSVDSEAVGLAEETSGKERASKKQKVKKAA